MRVTGVLASAFAAVVTAAVPAQAYTVHRGDTLWSIAQRIDGNGHDWRQITDMQGRHPNPTRLHVGEELVVPQTLPDRMYPPSAPSPAAGICTQPTGRTATVVLLDSMSDARCYQVKPGQELRIVDHAHRAARMHAPFLRDVVITPGRSYTVREPMGRYLAPGAHGVGSSLWCCFGFDLVLPGYKAPAPAPAG